MPKTIGWMLRITVASVFALALFGFAACSSGEDTSGEAAQQEVAQADDHSGHDHGAADDHSGHDHGSADDPHAHGGDMTSAADITYANPQEGVDPVCGMESGAVPAVVELDGKHYSLCSPGCAEAFKKDPQMYLTAAAKGEYKGAH